MTPDDSTAHHSDVWPVTAKTKLRIANPVAAAVITQTAIQSIRRRSAVDRITMPMGELSADPNCCLPKTRSLRTTL